jgi:hypothetical protein
LARRVKYNGKDIKKINMGVSARGNARILLGVNFILLFGFTFVFLFILLEKSVDMYDWLYNSTSKIQTIIVYCWFLAAGLSPVYAIALSTFFGDEIRKTTEWKSSMAIFIVAGLPSLAFVVIGGAMVYLL